MSSERPQGLTGYRSQKLFSYCFSVYSDRTQILMLLYLVHFPHRLKIKRVNNFKSAQIFLQLKIHRMEVHLFLL